MMSEAGIGFGAASSVCPCVCLSA